MKSFSFGFLIISWACSVFAQDSDGIQPPLPKGPLLKRAPDFSSWTVVSQSANKDSTANTTSSGEASDSKKPKIVRMVSVTKTGSIIHEQITDIFGKKSDIWHVDGLQFLGSQGGDISVFPDFGGGDIYTPNYAKSDFSGLDWISADTYTGVQKVMSHDCIIFKKEVNTLALESQVEENLESARALRKAQSSVGGGESNASVPSSSQTKVTAVAYIDLETRLPVAVTFGKETRFFKFGASPSTMLTLPEPFAAAQHRYQAQQTRLEALPSRP